MTVTVAQIKTAMGVVATAIETRPEGEKYWPIFERLERELVAREGRASRLAAARAAVQEARI